MSNTQKKKIVVGKLLIEKACKNDAEELALISKKAFENDIYYGSEKKGGPYGYDSPDYFQNEMDVTLYYKIVHGEQVIGGISFLYANLRTIWVSGIFIGPEHQNLGIGSQIFDILEKEFPHVERWLLQTPCSNLRNQHFYEKLGYERIAVSDDQVLYRKKSKSTQKKSGSPRVNMSEPQMEYINCDISQTDYNFVNLAESEYNNVNLNGSSFACAMLDDVGFNHAFLRRARFVAAYMSEEGREAASFEYCDLQGVTIQHSNLSGVAIRASNIEGMTIDGILLSDLMDAYFKKGDFNDE